MNSDQPPRSMIGIRTAIALYAVLVIACFLTLKRAALVIGLLIVLALAVKTVVHHLRGRME